MKLTKNFNLSEFECKCGCETPDHILENLKELADNLQKIRDVIKKPMDPTNGYRCPEHNAKVGGVKKSQHIHGKAADIQVDGLEPEELADIVENLMEKEIIKKGGVGRYNTFTHIDIRGHNARWNFTNK